MSWFMDLRRNGVVHLRGVETLKEVDLRKLGIVYGLWMVCWISYTGAVHMQWIRISNLYFDFMIKYRPASI